MNTIFLLHAFDNGSDGSDATKPLHSCSSFARSPPQVRSILATMSPGPPIRTGVRAVRRRLHRREWGGLLTHRLLC
jgi:hypothetical protein